MDHCTAYNVKVMHPLSIGRLLLSDVGCCICPVAISINTTATAAGVLTKIPIDQVESKLGR